jgi:hypothetical protein
MTVFNNNSIVAVQDFDPEAEVIIVGIVRGDDVESRNSIRTTIGRINKWQRFGMRFQMVFVLGWDTNHLTNEEQNKLVTENKKHNDLILPRKINNHFLLVLLKKVL